MVPPDPRAHLVLVEADVALAHVERLFDAMPAGPNADEFFQFRACVGRQVGPRLAVSVVAHDDEDLGPLFAFA